MKTLSEETEKQITWMAYGLFLSGLTEDSDLKWVREQLDDSIEDGTNQRYGSGNDESNDNWCVWYAFENSPLGELVSMIDDAESQLRSLAHFAIKHG
jgi:hypothetical protein